MNDTESKLLGLVLSEWCQLMMSDPAQRLREDFHEWKARQAAITDAARWGVQVDPCWLGSDAAGRQARRRALVALERDGWIIKKLFHRRLSFVKPTDMAIEAILQATSPKPPKPPPPTPLTSEQAAARDAATAAEPAAMLADTDDKLDALRDELNTGSEPRA